MSRFIGDDMLTELESRRDRLTPIQFESRRLEIEDLIRSGKAVELSPIDWVMRALTVLAGVGLFVLLATTGSPAGVIIGIGSLIAGVLCAPQWGRRRG